MKVYSWFYVIEVNGGIGSQSCLMIYWKVTHRIVDTLWSTYKKLWKITIFNGKTHYKWPFSIAMLVYQRVNHDGSSILLSLSYVVNPMKNHPINQQWGGCHFTLSISRGIPNFINLYIVGMVPLNPIQPPIPNASTGLHWLKSHEIPSIFLVPSGNLLHSYWKWPFSSLIYIDLPIQNGGVPQFFVCLPVAILHGSHLIRRVTMLESIMVAASASVRATRTRGEFSTSAYRESSEGHSQWDTRRIHWYPFSMTCISLDWFSRENLNRKPWW